MSELAGRGCEIIVPFDERQPLKDIERSIIKKYRKHLWSKFIKAIRDYNLVEEGDKIAVAISGGKDSLLMAKMFQELKRHGQVNFEVEFIAMDPGYHKDIKQLLIDNCEYLDIPIHLFDSRIFEIADEIAKEAEFFSFGTNDLTQMTYGFSRDDAAKFLNEYYTKNIFESDPFAHIDENGVGQLMQIAINKAKPVRPDIKLGICGEHGGDPRTVEFCHRIGLTYVSCSPYRVPLARLAAAQAAVKEKMGK